MNCYGFDEFFVALVCGGFHGSVDTGFFVVVLVVVFGGDGRDGWC